MIQIDNSEKASMPPPVVLAPPPPSYSQLSPHPSDAGGFNAGVQSHPLQSPTPTGALNSPTPTSTHPLYPTPSPLASPNTMGQAAGPSIQQQQPQASFPMATDAQLAAQYQSQLLARCARGDHDIDTKYGPCGIITAVICFPFGLIALFIDREKRCARCGIQIPDV